MTQAIRDENHVPVTLGQSSANSELTLPFIIDSATGRLLVDLTGGSGTVTTISVATANGLGGTVANPTTTPVITLSTTVTGLLRGNGTVISAAVANTDFQTPIILTTTGTSGAATFNGTTLNIPNYATAGAGITIGTTTITGGTTTRILYNNAGVVGEYTLSGTGTVVAMQTSPAFVTPSLGVASATSINGNFFTVGTYTLTGSAGKTLTFNNTITLAGTDATVMTFPTVSSTLARTSGTNIFTGVQSMTSPDFTTSVTTPSVSFTAYAGATTLLTIGGTGASASLFMPSTLNATSATTGAIRTSGGISAAQALWIGGLANIAGVLTTGSTIELGHPTDTTLSRVSAGVVAIEGVNILTTATGLPLAGGTMTGNIILGENASLQLDPAGSADGRWTGVTMTGISGYTQVFGDLVYLDSSNSRWQMADADAATTADRMLAMVVVIGTNGNACTLLLIGNIRADAKFPALTIGSAVYVGETAGAIQVAIPVGADNVIRRVGYALTADEIYFNPSMDSQVTVA